MESNISVICSSWYNLEATIWASVQHHTGGIQTRFCPFGTHGSFHPFLILFLIVSFPHFDISLILLGEMSNRLWQGTQADL
jgi:hypothetical protein